MSNFNILSNYLDSLPSLYKVPGGELLVFQDGEEKFAHCFGDRLLAENKYKDLYWFYSMTKLYTVTAAMQLVEQNKLFLDDKLVDILPSLKNLKKTAINGESLHIEKVTVRNLLSMTCGLNYNIQGPQVDNIRRYATIPDMEKIAKAIYTDSFVYEPGEHFQYSLGHDIIGIIIWKITGLTLDEYFLRYIFKPLSINNVGFFPSHEEKARILPQYNYNKENNSIEPLANNNQLIIHKDFASGGAGLFGRLDEYIKLPIALSMGGISASGERVLKEDTIRLMSTDVLSSMGLIDEFHEKFSDHAFKHFSYALGLRTKIQADNTSPVGEFGWDGAAGGFVLIDPVNHITIAYTQHVLHMGEKVYNQIHPHLRDYSYASLK